MAYTFDTEAEQVRLLINDTDDAAPIFADAEIAAYLALEGGNVKRAAAQALDTIADDEVLTSKAIKSQDLSTDGPKVAEQLRKRAAALRGQADRDDDQADEGFFEILPTNGPAASPELTGYQIGWL